MRITPAAAARELLRRAALRAKADRFEEFLTSPFFCDVAPSPLMRDIARAADGLEALGDAAIVRKHFGCEPDQLPRGRRIRTVAVRAGGRAGKTSRLLAPKALHAAWTVPLPTVAHGETAVALIVAPDMKLARQVLSFVAGYVDKSPVLRAALVKDPTVDAVTLRRPDGNLVRVEVLAANRGGRAVRARTLVFAGLDEAAFFFAEGTGVVNDQDIYNAVAQRVVPGGQVWIVSTPWLKGVGLLEKTLEADFGRHEHALCVTSGTRALNPTWDPDGEIERALREQDPDAAQREIDGLPLAGGAGQFFDPDTVEAAVDRTLPEIRRPLFGEQVSAGGDAGFVSDSAAMCVVHRSDLYRVGEILELRPEGGIALKPSAVVREFGAHLKVHGVDHLLADSHYRETVTEHLAEFGIGFRLAPTDVAAVYVKARGLFRERRVRIPNNPRLLRQLRAILWRPNPGGTVSIILPREREGGHCDIVSALVLALWDAAGMDVPMDRPKPGSREAIELEAREMEDRAARESEGGDTSDDWK